MAGQALAADPLRQAVDGPQRTEKNKARDVYRHPLAMLRFFGLRPSQSVLEIDPGPAGWWTEILAPYLEKHGRYIAAVPAGEPGTDSARMRAVFMAKLQTAPALYDKVKIVDLTGDLAGVPSCSVDRVLTFRNLHDWMRDGTDGAYLRAFYRVLKPGGVLGIEDHRASTAKPQDPQAASGYVREDYAVSLIRRAGFTLAARAGIGNNPKDTKDYPAGVWTLPPTYRLKDVDRAKYAAIGESDRFTLKFFKPRTAACKP